MATEAQIEANRRNAEKSTGPRTPEGKEKAARNAVKHGLSARAAFLHGEDWEAYVYHHEEMFRELGPEGMQEAQLARRIVDLSWRLQRAQRYHDEVFAAMYEKYLAKQAVSGAQPGTESGTGMGPQTHSFAFGDPILPVEKNHGQDAHATTEAPADPALLGRLLLEDFSGPRILERVLLYEQRIERSLHRAHTELRELRPYPRKGARRPSWEEYCVGHGGSKVERNAPAPEPTGSKSHEAQPQRSSVPPLPHSGPASAGTLADQSCKTNPIAAAASAKRDVASGGLTLPTPDLALLGSGLYKTNPMDVLLSLRKGDARVRLVRGKRA